MNRRELLERRIEILEKKLTKVEAQKMKNEAVPAIVITAAKAIAKNLPLIIKTFSAIKDALDKDPDTEQNEERKTLSDTVGKIIELVESVVEPLTKISKSTIQ